MMPSLKLLSLRRLKGSVPTGGLLNFKNLEYLDMSTSTINNSFGLQGIGMIRHLKILSLAGCGLTGPIPTGLCKLKFLQELDISGNYLNGSLPWCLANLTSLKIFSLSSNNFIGDIASSPLRRLTSLEYLDLSDNLFQIPISLSLFFNHSNLNFLDCQNNTIYAITEAHNFTPKFQLETLHLSGHGYGSVEIPNFLYHQYNLQYVDLSNNNIRGEFPFWLLGNNTKLRVIHLANNSLLGPFQLPIHSPPNLSFLDISENSLYGSIPKKIGTHLSRLEILNLKGNGLNGNIPPSFGNMSFLENLSHNNLIGKNSKNRWIDQNNSKLEGNINSKLRYIQLSSNHLEGGIPTQLCNLYNLSLIDLSHNNLSGHILPCLRLSSAWSKEDEFPIENNTFSPKVRAPPMVPPPYSPQPLEFTNKNESYSYQPSTLKYLSGIDLSCNNFSGEIPFEIGDLNTIQMLNLSHNSLTGSIPQTFSNLRQIESLDLSYNNLEGKIPSQITQLYSLEVFSVAHNNLSGKTPTRVAQFVDTNLDIIDEGRYEGKLLFLCGFAPLAQKLVMQQYLHPPRLPINLKFDEQLVGSST
ncbi:receptor-like protein 56 [Jatropha curcas]|uniref:receptor-like protein 56 n=1 Tax=Jatropha curcas TaxID=180498 RepID=UPI0018963C13|nr:receptor-like protein 56 [Jatropha curcas]